LIEISFNISLSYYIGQELFEGHFKSTFLGIEPDFVLLDMVKCLAQVLRMVGILKALHEHVINVYFHDTSNISLKTLLTIHWKVALVFFSPKGNTL